MARFNFRLKTLRRLREIDRDELRVRLATAFEAERILQQQQAASRAESTALAATQRDLMQGAIDVNRLLSAQRYQLALEAQQRVLGEQAVKLAEEVERRRQAVVEADRQVRTLDKLEERQRRDHRRVQEAVETKRLDEVGAVHWEATE